MAKVKEHTVVYWDELLKDADIKMPKYNTNLKVNISGLTVEGVAVHLYFLWQILKAAAAGYNEVMSEIEIPFICADIENKSCFEWEDDYKDGNYSWEKVSIIEGIDEITKEDGEKEWVIKLTDHLMELAKDNKSISVELNKEAEQ